MQKEIAGWLVIHTEGEQHETYELIYGKNIIGRKTPNNSAQIGLVDKYASRRHAVIFIHLNKHNVYEYYIADNKDANDGKESMNGTFVNGSTQRIGDKPVRIIDGDTIQIGETKLVLKTSDIIVDVEEAVKLVKRQEFQTTVDFRKQSKLKRKFRK